ncbi:YitT family protein [Lederbergia lenta]|uniref:Membrane protein n=1 Tax=Lederbergia lenta TaxID=1467 RepID=A0A2X4WCI7_LEDLE|nr:YitT family protein [Lederbergia lenta]MCM3110468.1 YitT family protein [Lederbergia lenta]MEC2323966.1 YitT family protein [Lederbergia lenta]SQI60891.1 membrane protein [Lederbergia lenta]
MANKQFSVWEHTKITIAVIFGALLNALALNYFLIPANVYASGLTGAAQLISNILGDFISIHISMGILLLVLNIPVVILGWLKVGRAFTLYSFISVVCITIFLEIIPIQTQAADIMLYAVFGGVISAVGIGITLKMGASTGGLDIIAMVLSRMNDKPVGTYFFIINAIIIVSAGAIYGWDKALYTLVSLYASTRVIDAIHTRHQKLTVMIVTKKTSELKEAIHARMVRGITVVPAKGAFSNEQKEMMMIVITRYELYEIEHIIKEIDPGAFTNIVQTTGVFGVFRKE